MAEGPNRVNVVQIDAPFPEQWRQEMFSFVKEIEGIRESLDVISTNTAKSVEASKNLADFYESGGLSNQSSQAVAPTPDPYVPHSGTDASSGASVARARLGQIQRGLTDEESLNAEGLDDRYVTGSGERSATASVPPDASREDKISAYMQDAGPLRIPRVGEFTAQNLLEYGGQMLGQRYLGDGMLGGNALAGAASQGLFTVANDWAPKAALAKQYATSGVEASRGLEQFGASLGYQNSGTLGSPLNLPGGLSFRVPGINPLARGGIAQYGGAIKDALTVPGMTVGESTELTSGLAETGWYPGSARYDRLRDMFKTGYGGPSGEVWKDPMIRQLADKATRQNNTPLGEFASNINAINDAAKQANVGLEDMKASMDEWGQKTQELGGTHFQGQQGVVDAVAATGLAPANISGLMDSPWSQSAVYRSTGLPPWMQGSLGMGTRLAGSLQGFSQAAASVPRPSALSTPIPGTGGEATDFVSGIEQQAGMMQKFLYPDMSPELIQKLLKRPGLRRRMEMGANAMGAARGWMDQVKGARGDPTRLGNLMSSGLVSKSDNKFTWGDLHHYFESARDPQTGKRLLSTEELKNVSDAGRGESNPQEVARQRIKELQKVLGDKQNASEAGKVTISLSPSAKTLLRLNTEGQRNKTQVNAGVPGLTTNNPVVQDGVNAFKALTNGGN